MEQTMDNTTEIQQRKAFLKAQIEQSRAQIREDVRELKEDFNPFRTAGHLIVNMLKPTPEARLTSSDLVNFGLDTGISMAINRFVPGANTRVVRVIAPVLLKNLALHLVPQSRQVAVHFLEWVVAKTAKKEVPKPLPLESTS